MAVRLAEPWTVHRRPTQLDPMAAGLDGIDQDRIHSSATAPAEMVQDGRIEMGGIVDREPGNTPGSVCHRDGVAFGKGITLDIGEPVDDDVELAIAPAVGKRSRPQTVDHRPARLALAHRLAQPLRI